MEFSFAIEKARIYVNKCAKTLAAIQKETGADVLINGGLYDMNYKDRPNLWLRVDGKTLSTDKYGYWCYGWDVSDFRMIHSSDIETVQNAICCTSLMKDGKKTILNYDDGQGGFRGRSAIGTLPDGRIIIFCSKDGSTQEMTPEGMQKYCLEHGWKDAIMLDSGGSSQCITPEGKITSTRKVHNVLCFWLKEEKKEEMKQESDNQTGEVNTMAKKTLGQAGLNLIKSFEGCRLTAYKPVETEEFYTIGWGHYGADVTKGMTITQARADELLLQDVAVSVAAVNNPYYCPITASLNQNQFDALVSFTFNCGAGNLKTLCKDRTAAQISAKIPAYNKAGGVKLSGLVRRRNAEQELFDKPVDEINPTNVGEVQIWLNRTFHSGLTIDGLYGSNTKKALVKALQQTLGVASDGIYGAKTNAAVQTLKNGSSGRLVKILQCFLICHKQKITADGCYGSKTALAVMTVQSHYKIDNDGIAGKMTFRVLCS